MILSLDLAPFLEARAAARGCIVVVRSTVGAFWRVGAFEAFPLGRFQCRLVGPVFGFVAWLATICAVRGEDALTRWVSSFLTEGASAEFSVREDLNVVSPRTESDEPLLVGTSLHEISQLVAAGGGDLDVPWSACVSFVVAVDFRHLYAHVGYHGFDDLVGETGWHVEDDSRVSDAGAVVREHRADGPGRFVPGCFLEKEIHRMLVI